YGGLGVPSSNIGAPTNKDHQHHHFRTDSSGRSIAKRGGISPKKSRSENESTGISTDRVDPYLRRLWNRTQCDCDNAYTEDQNRVILSNVGFGVYLGIRFLIALYTPVFP